MTVDLILQLALGAFSIFQSIRAKRYREATDTLVQAIEVAHEEIPNNVKKRVKSQSLADGNAAIIDKIVQRKTGFRK